MLSVITVLAFITMGLIYGIICYIQQKPEVNQSTFDIVTLHFAKSSLFLGFVNWIVFCFSLVIVPAPIWLVTVLETSVYIAFIYHAAAWTIVNIVFYGFLMYFSDISEVTDSQMRQFCIGTTVISVAIAMILDYLVPISNTAAHRLFGLMPDLQR